MASMLCPVRVSGSKTQAREAGRPYGIHESNCQSEQEVSVASMGRLWVNFRQEVAGKPEALWARVDPSIYSQCFLGIWQRARRAGARNASHLIMAQQTAPLGRA